MYTPSFRVKDNGVPVLSKVEIDAIGEAFVRDFQPGVLTRPESVDIESFIECYLGMTPDYQYLSHNGIFLGMTVFNDTCKVPVFDPVTNRAEYISARARTVIIDNRLLEENQRHRYRFTLGHEGGHDIFHSGFFSYNPAQLTIFDTPQPPMIQCRVDSTDQRKTNPDQWTDHERMEWQANRLSSAILMPSSAVQLVAKKYPQAKTVKTQSWNLTKAVSDIFDVSFEAATYRLQGLGLIPDTDNSNQAAFRAFVDFVDLFA